jgi:transcriptional regulator with XRE-family HTH domain
VEATIIRKPSTPATAALLAAVGENVLTHRETAGLTQKNLAERAGLSANYVSQIERGTANPRLLVMERLAKALDASVAELLDVGGSELGLIAANLKAGD